MFLHTYSSILLVKSCLAVYLRRAINIQANKWNYLHLNDIQNFLNLRERQNYECNCSSLKIYVEFLYTRKYILLVQTITMVEKN